MEYAYLGLFQKVFDWVLRNIFSPVFSFVSNLLSTVLSWIFQKILVPTLTPVFEFAVNLFIDLWKEIYSTHLYMLFSGLLKLIDYLEKAFDVFIGLDEVSYNETSGTLIEVLMQQKTISTVFWAITLGALGLALILTIYATAKSAFDLDFENKRPISKVLTAMMKTFIQFFTVPFFVYFFLQLSSVILKGVTSIFTMGEETTLGRTIFVIASLNAARNSDCNLKSAPKGTQLGITPADSTRYPFYSLNGNPAKNVSAEDYGNLAKVNEVFNFASFDYVIGFIAAIFLLFTIGICLIVFIQRIFELVLLYIVSPYFVCMMPLDDGEKFSRWREMFVAKCFTGFGSAVGMRLFLMICPMIMGNNIKFGTATSPEMDYMMKLFFLAGGAWAVYKSGPMITSLLSSQAGSSEANTAAMAGGMIYSYTAGQLIAKGQQALGSAFKGSGGKGGKNNAEGQGKNADGKFNGQKSSINSPVMRSSQMAGAGRPAGMNRGIGAGGSASASPGVGGRPAGMNRGIGMGGSASASPGVGSRPAGMNRGTGMGGSASASRGVGSRPAGINRGIGAGGSGSASSGVGSRPAGMNRGIGTGGSGSASSGVSSRPAGMNRSTGTDSSGNASMGVRNKIGQNTAQDSHAEYTGAKKNGLEDSGISVHLGNLGNHGESSGFQGKDNTQNSSDSSAFTGKTDRQEQEKQEKEKISRPGVSVNLNSRTGDILSKAAQNNEAGRFGHDPGRRHTISQGTSGTGTGQGNSQRARANTAGAYQGSTGRRPNENYRLNIGGSRYTIGSGGEVLSRRFPGSVLDTGKITLTRAGSLGSVSSNLESNADGRYKGSSNIGSDSSSYSSSSDSSSYSGSSDSSSYSSSYSGSSDSSSYSGSSDSSSYSGSSDSSSYSGSSDSSSYSSSSDSSSYSSSSGSSYSGAGSGGYSGSSSSRPQPASSIQVSVSRTYSGSQISGSAASTGGVRGTGSASSVSVNYQVSSAPIPAVRKINVSNSSVKYSNISIRGLSHNGQQNGRPFTRRSGQ